MPSSGCSYYGFWEADPRKWDRCLKQAGATMLNEGWHPKAKKFDDVRRKRAMKLWDVKS